MDKTKTIIGCGLAVGKDRKKIQKSSGMALRTFDRRMADPDKLTLGEFRQIALVTHMPDQTIVKMVKEIHRRSK